MYLVKSFDKEENPLKEFYIEGTNKDVMLRRAKEKLGIRGIKCRIKEDDTFITLIPNNIKIKIKIQEV